MITLEALYAKNYKAYKELDFSVSKFTLFIGKNSAGKSSIIRLVPFIINSLRIPSDIKDNLRHMFFMIKRINQMGSLEIK